MNEHSYVKPGEHTEQIGKTTFIVYSFADMTASRTVEQIGKLFPISTPSGKVNTVR